MVTFWFVTDPFMLREQRYLTIYMRRGLEGVMARRSREYGGGRVWV